MNAARYTSYQSATEVIGELHSVIGRAEAVLLHDVAEAFLLGQHGSPDVETAIERGSRALTYLVDQRHMNESTAELCWAALCACGPPRLTHGEQVTGRFAPVHPCRPRRIWR